MKPGFWAAALVVLPLLVVPARGQDVLGLNDYPTETRADYVYACMAVNGQTRDALRRCSCSIDVIASVLSYDNYVKAETMLSMRQMGGENSAMFRETTMARDAVGNLRRAQAEAEIRCF